MPKTANKLKTGQRLKAVDKPDRSKYLLAAAATEYHCFESNEEVRKIPFASIKQMLMPMHKVSWILLPVTNFYKLYTV